MAHKVAIVTGGCSGIGLAICRRLARDGIRTIALDLASGELDGDEPPFLTWLRCDVSDVAAMREAVSRVASEHGTPTIAVHCAAVQQMIPFDQLGPEVWERTWRVNVGGAVNLAQAVAPGMRATGWGRILFVASSSVVTPPPALAHYIATKSGLIGLARGLASEFGPYGITVNALAPGLTRTRSAIATVPEAHFELVRGRQQLPRSGEPEDQAAAAAFLVSEDAAFVTGQTLLVDGGEGHL